MKERILLLLLLSSSPAWAQQFTDADIKKAFNLCREHRVPAPGATINGKVMLPPPDSRNKDWSPGWENCSAVQDVYEIIEQREVAAKSIADKALVDSIGK